MEKGERWKLLLATSDESEAYLVKSRLEGEGIACKIEAGLPYPGVGHGGRSKEVSVYVALEDFEASQQALEEKDSEEDFR
jgi:nitrogenase subunit NifH